MDPNGPFGAKEASEGPLSGIMSAVAAAVEDAIGIRVKVLPISPSRVFAALQNARNEAAAAAISEEQAL